jgi:hypothetical protein
VVRAGVLVGEGIGDGAPVATRGCVGGVWWTWGHPTRGRAAGGVVVGAGASVGVGVGDGAPVATRRCVGWCVVYRKPLRDGLGGG